MLFRKIESEIEEHFKSGSSKILLIDGARQVGKTFIIRKVGKGLFPNFIEFNMVDDFEHDRLFEKITSVEEFHFRISAIVNEKLGNKEDTLIFFDEIQQYPHLLTLLKSLQQEDRYTYVASGSLLGVTLRTTTSIPMGSIRKIRMFPLDFEEFLLANGFGKDAISVMETRFLNEESMDEEMHDYVMGLFKRYLLVGGLPEAVNAYISTHNIWKVREIHRGTIEYYKADASKYDSDHRLKIARIYDMIPSNLTNKKKRVVAQRIENKRGKTFADYRDEFDYLISEGIALEVKAVSTPVFPLPQISDKNLLKLYLNDVGLLTCILFDTNVNAVLDDHLGINLGSIYENVVASELMAHGHDLFYYDNRNKGEVDFLIDDIATLSTMPLEIKSGKDYAIHSALSNFVGNEDYHVSKACVLSNKREVRSKGKIVHMPIYYIMFFHKSAGVENLMF